MYIPPDALYRNTIHLTTPTEPLEKDVKTLYRWQIKPLHGAIVDFLGKMDIENNPKLRDEMSRMHLRAFYVIEIIKDSKHLQKNMHKFLSEPDSAVYADYLALQQRVFEMLIDFCITTNCLEMTRVALLPSKALLNVRSRSQIFTG
ncbi:hypothetical protein [Moraxella bovoculi]|uniref:hypothetical protein n=1 Tax=Moraxella bovoculi TaxID=386891 RepID=UPI001D0D44D4|nr:hypothetical protein [Moraxella bovoculi]